MSQKASVLFAILICVSLSFLIKSHAAFSSSQLWWGLICSAISIAATAAASGAAVPPPHPGLRALFLPNMRYPQLLTALKWAMLLIVTHAFLRAVAVCIGWRDMVVIGLTIPFTIFLNSCVEWVVHGPLMHGRLGVVLGLRAGHEEHHDWFVGDRYSNANHGNSVALPWWAFVIVVGSMSLAGWILSALFGPALLYTMVAVSAAYYVFYQYVHTSMHIPGDRWITKTRWFARRNKYHKAHHNAQVEFDQSVNICIVCTWADSLYKLVTRTLRNS